MEQMAPDAISVPTLPLQPLPCLGAPGALCKRIVEFMVENGGGSELEIAHNDSPAITYG